MIFTICIREIRDHLKSPFFLIGTVLAVFLCAYATVIGANDYRQRRDDYLAARSGMEVSAYRYYVFRPPNPMSIFVQGYDTRAGTTAALYSSRIPVKTAGYMDIMGASQAERYDSGFLSIDYAFVIRVVLSLLVIFLVFDVIAGDRQRGTLKLILANPVPRDNVLLGKLLGGWCVVTALLTAASIISLIFALVNPDVRIGGDAVLRFLGIYASSVLYLSFFFTLGMWISVVINRPSTVLITLLAIWVAVTAIIPTVGCLAAERLIRPPGEERLQSMKAAALQPSSEEYDQARKELFSLRPVNPSYNAAREKFLNIEGKRAQKIYEVDRIWLNALDRQASVAVMLSIASPAAVYDQAVMRFAGTSSEDYERFLSYLRTTWNTAAKANRLLFRDRKESRKILESIEPFHPGDTPPNLPKAMLFVGILGFASILFFSLAYTGFLRKDVR